MYLINPLNKVKAYIKGGANFSISLKKNNDIYTKSTASSSGLMNGTIHTHDIVEKEGNLISIKSSFLSVLASIGIIDGRHRFELSWSPNFQAADKTPKPVFYDHLYPFKLGSYAIYYFYSLFPGKAEKVK